MNLHSKNKDYSLRSRVFVVMILLVGLFFISRFFYLQVIDSTYKKNAASNAFLEKTLYPSRGLIYDRNGKLVVANQSVYDVMLVMREMIDFDTLAFCNVLDISLQEFDDRIKNIKNRKKNPSFSRFTPQVFVSQLVGEDFALLQEKMYKFPGIFIQQRVLRKYNEPYAAHAFGSIGEVNRKELKSDEYYSQGDYIGKSGIEKVYEKQLRGQKGKEILLRDVYGRIKGNYLNGANDILPVAGKNLVTSIDIELQKYGEKLMQGKLGSIVAIEPETGEILALVSAPTYDPSLLVGRGRSKNYMTLLNDTNKTLFDRPVMAQYPPGSTFKLAQALIFLQEGIVNEHTSFTCKDGYYYTKTRKVGCHPHKSPVDLRFSIQTSCNAYYCYGLKGLLDNRLSKYGTIQNAYNVWRDYIFEMGFGDTLGIDFPNEKWGVIYKSSSYDKIYGKRGWRSSTIISTAIGQGEILCTPIQIANFAALLANRGYFYTPHIIKSIQGDSISKQYRTKNKVSIDKKHFDDVIDGMSLVMKKGAGRYSKVEGIDICGKTGTAQNPHGEDHSIFMAFAPQEKPKIAIAVYIENSGFGAAWAVPVATLMIEKYINREISDKRKHIEKRMLDKRFY